MVVLHSQSPPARLSWVALSCPFLPPGQLCSLPEQGGLGPHAHVGSHMHTLSLSDTYLTSIPHPHTLSPHPAAVSHPDLGDSPFPQALSPDPLSQ